MTEENLMDAIGMLPDDLITAADRCRMPAQKSRLHWQRWTALAASFAVLLGISGLLLPDNGRGAAADKAVPAEVSMAAPKEEVAMEVIPEEALQEEMAAYGAYHPAPLTLQWDGDSIRLEPISYTVTRELEDGTTDTAIACGPPPLDAGLEPHLVTSEQIVLSWDRMPDEITVQCWSAARSSETWGIASPAEVTDGVLHLQPDRQIYEITARWGEVCTASYAVYLDYGQ